VLERASGEIDVECNDGKTMSARTASIAFRKTEPNLPIRDLWILTGGFSLIVTLTRNSEVGFSSSPPELRFVGGDHNQIRALLRENISNS